MNDRSDDRDAIADLASRWSVPLPVRRATVVGVVATATLALIWATSIVAERSAASALAAGAVEDTREGGAPPARSPVLALLAADAAADKPAAPGFGAGEQVEVCGIGWVAAEADGSVDVASIAAAAPVAQARERLLRSIRADGDDFAVAASIWLDLVGASGDGGALLPIARSACAADPKCDEDAVVAETKARAKAVVDRLVAHASTTSDPRAYALAVDACSASISDRCALLTLARWQQLDAGNALPWLHALAEASKRGDGAAVDAALTQAGADRRLLARPFDVAALVARHAGAAPVDRLAAQQLASRAAALVDPVPWPWRPLREACSAEALTRADRRAACEAIASTLTDRSDSTGSVYIGGRLGQLLGWPDDRLERGGALFHAAADAAARGPAREFDPARPSAFLREPLDCATVAGSLAYFGRQARVGQVEATREWLAARGADDTYRLRARQTLARWAAEDRERAAHPQATTVASTQSR